MVRVAAFLLSATSFAVSLASADPLRSFSIPSFDYGAMQHGEDVRGRMLEALRSDGIIALRNVPNYANARERFLQKAAECTLNAKDDPTTRFLSTKQFSDGTKRFTMSTNAGTELDDAAADTVEKCPGYKEHYHEFSRVLEHAVNNFGVALDHTPLNVVDGAGENVAWRKLISEAVRLDHFHAYEPADEPTDGAAHRSLSSLSLPLHEDHGLFIAMAAPKFFNVNNGRQLQERELASDASGLVIQTSAGDRVRPVLKDDELVIMMGTGASRWLATSHDIPAVMHGMKMPEELVHSNGQRSLRAWFGKMTLLPSYHRMLQSQGMAFEEHVNRTTRFVQTREDDDIHTIGCATGRRLSESDGKCTLRQCTTKDGEEDPEEGCDKICNREGHSDSDAATCTEKCTCTESSDPAERCWMLCVANLSEDKCPTDEQTCKGQSIICKDDSTTPHSASPSPTPTESDNAGSSDGEASPNSNTPSPNASSATVAMTSLTLLVGFAQFMMN